MRIAVIVGIVLCVAVGAYLLAAHLMGGTLPTFGLPIGGESAVVRKQAVAFVEDLHFRDLSKAAQMLSPGEQNVDALQALLQRMFNANPAQLDLGECVVDKVEVDSTETRARVKLKVRAKDLTSGRTLQPEMLLFFRRAKTTDSWYLVTN